MCFQAMADTSAGTEEPELTEVQRKRIAENRERALQIKRAKLALKSIEEK